MRLHPFRASGRTRESLQNGLVAVTHWDWAWQWSTMPFREEADCLDPRSEFISGKYAFYFLLQYRERCRMRAISLVHFLYQYVPL